MCTSVAIHLLTWDKGAWVDSFHGPGRAAALVVKWVLGFAFFYNSLHMVDVAYVTRPPALQPC